MSFTGVDSLDRSIDKANAWLADIDGGFGTSDRRLAYRVLRAWLHNLRDRLSVEVGARSGAPSVPSPVRTTTLPMPCAARLRRACSARSGQMSMLTTRAASRASSAVW